MCECGKEGIYVLSNLKNSNTKSCGCWNDECTRTHGMSHTRQYQCWADMKTRCDNIDHKWYPEYGGRGIGYPEKWVRFEGFWEDMQEGYSDKLTIDRIDNELSYSKENCRWATAMFQSHNQRKSKNAKNKYLGVQVTPYCDNINVGIKMDGKRVSLGTYLTEELAAKAYDDAAEIIYGGRPNNTLYCEDEILTKVKDRIEGSKLGKSFKASGSDFKNAKINEETAKEIYILANSEGMTQKQIASKYDITQCMVSSIKRGKSWKDATKDIVIENSD